MTCLPISTTFFTAVGIAVATIAPAMPARADDPFAEPGPRIVEPAATAPRVTVEERKAPLVDRRYRAPNPHKVAAGAFLLTIGSGLVTAGGALLASTLHGECGGPSRDDGWFSGLGEGLGCGLAFSGEGFLLAAGGAGLGAGVALVVQGAGRGRPSTVVDEPAVGFGVTVAPGGLGFRSTF